LCIVHKPNAYMLQLQQLIVDLQNDWMVRHSHDS
jgi:hypothetical protein